MSISLKSLAPSADGNALLRRLVVLLLACSLSSTVAMTTAMAQAPAQDGVNVGKPSALRNLVPAAQLEQQSALQYR